jgi:hypothetical protein
MKVKIAAFGLVQNSPKPLLFDHEPVTPGWCQRTEWVEVELPDLAPEAIAAMRLEAVAAERADLEKRLAALQ